MPASHRIQRQRLALTLLFSAATCSGLFLARAARGSDDPPPSTVLISRSSGGAQGADASHYPAISADGRFLAFASDASNLVSDDTNGAGDIFVKDTQTGSLVCASRNSSGGPAQGESYAASISADGQRVAFASAAPDLVAGDTNELPDVFVRDLAAGTTQRASLGLGGAQADGASGAPRLCADGQWVVFASRASNLVADDGNDSSDVFVWSTAGGTLELESRGVGGAPSDGASEGGALSADGRYVVFASTARDLVAGENAQSVARSWNVYRRDRVSGLCALVSATPTGLRGNGSSHSPAVSADGRYVAFASLASDLVASDLDQRLDVFVRDVVAGTTLRVSVGVGLFEPTGPSSLPSISADGRLVTFESAATNLVDGFVPSGSSWCYVRNLATSTTLQVVSASPEPAADGGTVSPAISADGRWVAFSSTEPALVGSDANGREDVFLRGPLP
ncbi:MAG: PD40 domain-containing protein [Planctomycetes bacterium]|nr:PD40 domain-containing protein [Planctomycetota bacterium]